MFQSDDQDKVTHFGEWAEGASRSRLRSAAFDVLHEAAARCVEQDMRSPELDAALAHLSATMTRRALLRRFRQALDLCDPLERERAALDALRRVARALEG